MNPTRQPTLAEAQARIDAARDYYLSQGKTMFVIETPEREPHRPRKDWIDPETVLKRKSRQLTRHQREKLRAMAEAL